MTTLEVLQKARDHLARPRMWIRGWGRVEPGGDGETCAVGAVKVACGLSSHYTSDNADSRAATRALAEVLGEPNRYGRKRVIQYNDSHSKECVLTMFDAAIENEKRKVE